MEMKLKAENLIVGNEYIVRKFQEPVKIKVLEKTKETILIQYSDNSQNNKSRFFKNQFDNNFVVVEDLENKQIKNVEDMLSLNDINNLEKRNELDINVSVSKIDFYIDSIDNVIDKLNEMIKTKINYSENMGAYSIRFQKEVELPIAPFYGLEYFDTTNDEEINMRFITNDDQSCNIYVDGSDLFVDVRKRLYIGSSIEDLKNRFDYMLKAGWTLKIDDLELIIQRLKSSQGLK